MRSYYTNDEKTEIAFCMPINEELIPNFKIVRQNQKKRSLLIRILNQNFRTEEEAQLKLDKIANAKGWKVAFEE